MVTHLRVPRALIASLSLVAFPLLVPSPASGQEDLEPPAVWINPIEGTFTNSSLSVTIEWCDNYQLIPSSRRITLNGVLVTGSFNYTPGTMGGCVAYATSQGTITLNPGSNTLYAEISDFYSNEGSGAASYTYSTDKLLPVISTSPYNGENRDVSFCVAQCFDVVQGYATPAYISMDTPRSATLVYRSSQADPRPVVQVDARDDSPTPASKMSIGLKRPDGSWVNLTSGATEVYYQRGTGDSRMAAQFDASILATGAYDYTVVVRSWWPDGTMREATSALKVLILNEKDSEFGWGWSLAGLERVYEQVDGAVVLTGGNGSISRFPRLSCPSTCSYAAPNGDFTTLTRRASWGNNLKWDRRAPDGTTATYHADGRIAYVEDRFGNRTSFAYTGNPSRLASITDPAGKQITFGYGGDGKLDWIKDAGNRYSYVTVDGALNVTAIQDPGNGFPFQATYDSRHRPISRADRRGATWGIGYDFTGKVSADTSPVVIADSQSVRLVAQFRSSEYSVLIDPASGLGTSLNPAPRVVPADIRARVTNPRGHATNYQLNQFGAPLRVEEPLGRVTTFAYTAHSQVASQTSPSGHLLEYGWSGPNLLWAADRTTSRTVWMEYELTYNQLTRSWGDTDSLWNYWSSGRLDSTRTARSSRPVTKFTYDSRGRVRTRIDQGGHTTTLVYAATGMQNQSSVTVAGRTTTYTDDAYGRRAAVTEPDASTYSTRYDELNRPTEQIGALNDTTRLIYNELHLVSVRDAKGQLTQFSRNALGWQESFTDPAGNSTTSRFDRAGNLVSTTNRRGQIATFAYDALNQPISRSADGRTTTFAADPLGRFTAASNAESVDTVKYDVAGRVEREIAVRGGTRYVRTSTFDNRDRRTALAVTEPWTATVGYHYTAEGLLDSLTNMAGARTSLGADIENLLASIVLPTEPALTVTREHPSTHTTAAILYNIGTLYDSLSVQYTRTPTAQVYQRIDVAQSSSSNTVGRQYAYDRANRLLSYHDFSETVAQNLCGGSQIVDEHGNACAVPGERTTSNTNVFAYDLVGNRSDSGAVALAGNRLTKFKGDSMTYDADGNLVRHERVGGGGSVSEYFWSTLGELDSARTNGVTVARFGYDGFGRRVRKSTSSATRTYLHDGAELLVELDGAGSRVAEYTYYPGVDQPHSVRRWSGGTSATYYFATDHPGNVVGLIDGSNRLVNRYKYTPRGTLEAAREEVENNLRFGAREHDAETGLYYNRARYYDASLARFISEDPSGFAGGANLYTFASNDPMNRRDPFGLKDDCTTIEVKVNVDGKPRIAEVTICKGAGSVIGQILDFAGTIGVGNGSYYWGGQVFATPSAIAANGGFRFASDLAGTAQKPRGRVFAELVGCPKRANVRRITEERFVIIYAVIAFTKLADGEAGLNQALYRASATETRLSLNLRISTWANIGGVVDCKTGTFHQQAGVPLP